ncbi:LOW QUALITY PROTEIN: hypothetical protein QYF61_027131, partial [Mycteria americana]
MVPLTDSQFWTNGQTTAAVKGPEGVLEWTSECRKSFDEIKRKLMEAPALELLNLRKPFQLYVHEQQQVALGILTQRSGSWKRPVGYFSKQLDEVSKGWPACLGAVAATATLIEESWKLMLGQLITVFIPHAVFSLLENKGHHWMSPSRPDLQDEPLPNAELELFTDGSSFMLEGRRKAGYAGKRVNIYTDSKYAFGAVHAHGAIWKERGLLSSYRTPIKYGIETMKLLQAVPSTEGDGTRPRRVDLYANWRTETRTNQGLSMNRIKSDRLHKPVMKQWWELRFSMEFSRL